MILRPRLGLALGGGGARGGAHLGVLRVLNECGYRPDVVVGTSIGGLMAVMIGAGWSLEEMERFFFETDFTAWITLDRSGEGLIGLNLFAEELDRLFGEADMADLKPRTAVIAADIRRRQRILIDRGSVKQAILATIAVPGLFPPVRWGDYLLVDGGVVDNVPVEATYRLGAQRVIAVDVEREDVSLGAALEDVRVFSKQMERMLYWLLSLAKRQAAFDTFIQSMVFSFQLLAHYQLAANPPDVLIRPDMSGIGLLTMERIKEAAEAGEQVARTAIPQIKRLMQIWPLPRRDPGPILPLVPIEVDGTQKARSTYT